MHLCVAEQDTQQREEHARTAVWMANKCQGHSGLRPRYRADYPLHGHLRYCDVAVAEHVDEVQDGATALAIVAEEPAFEIHSKGGP